MELLIGIAGVIVLYLIFKKTPPSEQRSDSSRNQPTTVPTQNLTPEPNGNLRPTGISVGGESLKPSRPPERPLSSPPLVKPAPKPFSFCALDTETTGIVPKSRRHRAFEISCVRFTPVDEKRWSKKRFTRFLSVDEKEMNGLKLSPMWKDHVSGGGQDKAVDPSIALSELRDFVEDLPFVCHNAPFDKCVIENEIEKVSYRWTPRNRWICTLLMARSGRTGSFVGYSPGRNDGMSYKLEHVAEALGLGFDRSQLHLGYYDAEIAGTIFLKLHHLRNLPIQTVQ